MAAAVAMVRLCLRLASVRLQRRRRAERSSCVVCCSACPTVLRAGQSNLDPVPAAVATVDCVLRLLAPCSARRRRAVEAHRGRRGCYGSTVSSARLRAADRGGRWR